MSDSSKRPGTSRDISELKARLGLKKGAPAPTAKNGGAVVPPPGVALPAPPGVSTQPAGPVVPKASDDPFGAMNAMAQIGTMQRAPEIVIVNDGKAVEQVGASKRAGTIVKYAVVAVIPLAIGIAVGQIAKEAKIYNAGIADAKLLLTAKDGVKDVKKRVVALQAALEKSEKVGFKPDPAITTELSTAMTNLEVNQAAVFRTKQNSLSADLSGSILTFYAGVAEVRDMLKDHLEQGKLDDQMLADASKKSDDNKPTGYIAQFGDYKYGVLISATAPGDTGAARFGAKIVELGKPYCSDGSQSQTFECPDAKYSSVNYFDSVWTKGEPQMNGSSADAKKVVPLLANQTSDILLKGGMPGVVEALYARRLEALKKRVDDLIKQGNSTETKLTPKTKEADKFHFGFL